MIQKTNPCIHGKSGITSELKQLPSIKLTKKKTYLLRSTIFYTRASRYIKYHFAAIYLFNELIIHAHLESWAMNITDDTHEAI